MNKSQINRSKNMQSLPIPKVSIICVTYNQEAYIAQTIQGFLDQKVNFPLEIVIGEDCSSDATLNIVNQFKAKYPELIRVVSGEHNVGSLENFARAYRACRGEFIALCEGDDYWTEPNKLQIQYDFLKGNPEYGLVHTGYKKFFQATGKFKNRFNKLSKVNIPSGEVFEPLLISHNFVGTFTTLFRRSLFDLEAHLEQMKNYKMGDYYKWLELARKSKVKYFKQEMAVRRILENSASQSNDLDKKIAFFESTIKLQEHFIRLHGMSDLGKKQLNINQQKEFFNIGLKYNNDDYCVAAYQNLQDIQAVSFSYRMLYLIRGSKFLKKMIFLLYELTR